MSEDLRASDAEREQTVNSLRAAAGAVGPARPRPGRLQRPLARARPPARRRRRAALARRAAAARARVRARRAHAGAPRVHALAPPRVDDRGRDPAVPLRADRAGPQGPRPDRDRPPTGGARHRPDRPGGRAPRGPARVRAARARRERPYISIPPLTDHTWPVM